MSVIDNITTNNHHNKIINLSRTSDTLIIVSPFCFTDFSGFICEIAQTSVKDITLITTLKEEEYPHKIKSLKSFYDNSAKHSIKASISVDNKLHGKIYIFKNNGACINAIITSANITNNGLYKNHEWGYCISNQNEIISLENNIFNNIQYNIDQSFINQAYNYVKDIKTDNQPKCNTKLSNEINHLILTNLYNITLKENTNIFIKPVGSSDNKVFNGDFSDETRQYFSKKRPASVHKGDYLISYAVGATKIISIFEVKSDQPQNTNNEQDRWPWYVEVKSLTPKLGANWWEISDLHIMSLVKDYTSVHEFNITNAGGRTLNGLKFGADKIKLSSEFGNYLLTTVLSIEKGL